MRKTKKTLAILAIVAMVLAMLPVQVFAATTSAADSDRYAGTDRIGTALAVAANWTSANAVVLAPADDANLVDALAAAPLAGQENAPILLTYKDGLNADVKAKIAALGASKVYVVGAAANDAVVNSLTGVTVEKLTGADRWATAAAINAKLTNVAGTFVVGYDAIADALSAASYAAANKYQIALTNVDGSVDASRLAGSKTYLVGGTGVVKDYAGATARFGGADRYVTNTEVVKGLSYEYSKVYIANGDTLVDALVAAPLAAQAKAAVLLADPYNSSVAAASEVNGKLSSTSKVIALGGTGVVSDAVKGSVSYTAPAVLSVESVSAINLNQVKVVFTQEVDETSAETATNYTLAGADLGASDKFELQSDKKTLIINLNTAQAQYGKAILKVKGNVITGADASVVTVPEFSQELTFSDVTVPTVTQVKVTGNKKLTVTFSETVTMPAGYATAAGTKFKIDGQYLTSYGFSSATVLNLTANNYANKIELNFAVAIPAGSHTFTTLKGDATNLIDAANFKVAEQSSEITVLDVTGAPTVTNVTGETNGTVYVTYDRSMDSTTALGAANYRIAGSTVAPTTSFKSGTDSKVVKLVFGTGVVVNGSNILVITKDTVKDSYGNKLNSSEDTRISFNASADTVKPTVTSVTALTNTKVRVKFSEVVSNAYAINLANYKLKDSSGTTVTISLSTPVGTAPTDTYDLTTPALTGSNYTLEIKNIVDLGATPNVMDTYTATFSGKDDVAPTVTESVQTGTSKVAVMFSEAMDSATITDTDNYYYIDNATTPVTRALPSGSTVVAGADNKSVEISFPSAYTVRGVPTTEYSVIKLVIGNVKDVAGNVLQNISTTSTIAATGTGTVKPSYVADTFILTSSTGKVTAEFELNQNITTLDYTDFRVAGEVPNAGYLSGKKVVLEFTDTTAVTGNIAVIKAAGNGATLATATTNSTNVYGTTIAAIAPTAVYDDQIAPKLSTIAVDPTDPSKIIVTFSEAIDQTILGLYTNDFTVESNGQVITINSVTNGGAANKLSLNLASALTTSAVVKVAATVDIKDLAGDIAETANPYVPTTDDKNGTNGSIAADVTAPAAPTAVAVTPVGGTVVADTLNSTNTNMTATATITAAQATGGKAELYVGATKVATDATILAADTTVAFDIGATSTATLQAAVTAGGVVTVQLYDAGGNFSTSAVANPTLVVDYVAPTVTTPFGTNTGLAATTTIAGAGGTATITFSEALDAASKTAVENAITAAATGGTLGYGWVGAVLTITNSGAATPANDATFAADVTFAAGALKDVAGNPNTGVLIGIDF